ncbi:MAG: hypothetical protein PHR35_00850 [Kiritimatiellae bacterium]|nr:hypothetical protein [Kiritimatiellia bacterium]
MTAAARESWRRPSAVALQALSGGVALACCVSAWSRMLPVWSDGSPAAAGAAIVIGALAAVTGWFLATRAARRLPERFSVDGAAWSMLAAGLWAMAVLRLLPSVTDFWLRRLGAGDTATFGVFQLWQAGGLAVAIFPACLGFGAALRLLAGGDTARSCCRRHPRVPVWLGAVAGFMLGRLICSGLIVPWHDAEGWLRMGVVVGGLSAVFALWRHMAETSGRRMRLRHIAACAPLAAVALALLLPRIKPPWLSQSPPNRWLRTGGASARLPGEMIFHADGSSADLSVRRLADGERVLCRDGQAWLSASGDLPSQMLAAHLPLLLHPAPRRVALLGLGSGSSLSAALTHPIEQVVCAEPERRMPDAVRTLAPAPDNATPAWNDPRYRHIPVSACELLARGRGRYDVIVTQPELPWSLTGARGLTRRHFARCRAALATNGIVCVSVPAQAMSPREFRRVLAAFRAVWPCVQVWSPQVNSYLLLGSLTPLTVRGDRLLERFERREVFRDLVRIGVRALPELLANQVLDGGAAERYLDGDACAPARCAWSLAWACARARLQRGQTTEVLAGIEAARNWSLDWLTPGELEESVYRALSQRTGRLLAARAAIAAARVASRRENLAAALARAREAAAINRDDAFLERMVRAMEQDAALSLARGDFAGASRRYADVLGILPSRASAAYGAAMADSHLGRAESAYLHLARAVAAEPRVPAYRLALAEAAWTLGNEEESLRQYRLLIERDAADVAALHGLAVALSRAKPPLRDAAAAIRAAEQAVKLTGCRDRRMATTLADLYIANGRVVEGVSLKRRIKIALPDERQSL